MNINKVYENVAPYLIHSELVAAVERRGGKIDDNRSYVRTLPGGRFRGEIVARFPTQVRRIAKSGTSVTKEVAEDEMVPAFDARVVGRTDKCQLMIEAREDIIGMGRLIRIEKDLKLAVGSREVTGG